MAIIKNGSFTTTASSTAQNLNLGFIPTRFTAWNLTNIKATGSTVNAAIASFLWVPTLPNGDAIVTTYTNTSGAQAQLLITSNGVTPYITPLGLEYVPLTGLPPGATSTSLTITGITKAAQASVTATHAFTSADIGVTTVTFHGVNGMNQINTLRGVIQSVTSTTSFTVNINTTTFSSYISGGYANIITGVPPYTTQSFQIFNTPQYNVGFEGLTFGTALMVNATDSWYYEAVLDAPFTSA